tara:strand:+ start:47 stop:1255 length:1209 start_codon:yes stop_codon:yes gene_type:complete
MRIAMLADFYPPYNRGGAGVVAHRLAKYFARQGHEILVVTTVQEEVLQKEYEIDGVAVIAIPVNYPERFRNFLGVNNPSAVASVRSSLAEFKPDLVHAHNIHHYLSLACIRASDHMGWPTVVTSHDYLFVCCGRLTCTTGPQCFRPNIVSCAMTQRLRFNPFRNAAARKIINSHSSYVLAISDVMRRALEINGIERVETIHNGIDVDEWVPQYLDMNTEIRPKVTLPGRISDEKGAEVLLKAVAEVPISDRPTIVFLGDNPRYETKLRAFAESVGLSGCLEITGWLSSEAVRDTLINAQIVTTPSIYPDPFNLGNIEAMSLGIPVIGTCFGGAPEIIVDGETGFIIDPRDSIAFSTRLIKLLRDKKLRDSMGRAGRRRVEELFTLKQQADKTMDKYLEAGAF